MTDDNPHDGDFESATGFDEPIGTGLTPIPVDLELLSMLLEGDPVHCDGLVDLDTGEVWGEPQLDLLREEDVDLDEKFPHSLRIDGIGSRPGFEDMADFVDEVEDEKLAGQLVRALRSSRPFRRFKDVLEQDPDRLAAFHQISDARRLTRAAQWLADQGYASSLPAASFGRD
jgi:hypothetical protein